MTWMKLQSTFPLDAKVGKDSETSASSAWSVGVSLSECSNSPLATFCEDVWASLSVDCILDSEGSLAEEEGLSPLMGLVLAFTWPVEATHASCRLWPCQDLLLRNALSAVCRSLKPIRAEQLFIVSDPFELSWPSVSSNSKIVRSPKYEKCSLRAATWQKTEKTYQEEQYRFPPFYYQETEVYRRLSSKLFPSKQYKVHFQINCLKSKTHLLIHSNNWCLVYGKWQ